MKRSLLIAIAATVGTLLGQSLQAQTVATDPVGFTTTTIQSGKLAALSLPLDSISNFTGPTTTVTASSIQSTGAGWATNAYGPFATNPYVIRVLSGTSQGRQFRIDSNTTDTLTISTGGDLTTQIANGDRYEIIKVQTLLSLFGAGAPGLSHTTSVQTDPAAVDNILIRGSAGYLTYYYDDVTGHWLRQAGGTTNRDNTPLLPDQGFLFNRRAPGDYALTVLGAVPVTNLKTDLPANTVTNFPNRFPVATTLSALGLQTFAQWVKESNSSNPNPAAVDTVLIRGSAGWLTYYYASDVGHWLRQGGGTTSRDSTPIDIGSSVLIVRVPGSNITLNQPALVLN